MQLQYDITVIGQNQIKSVIRGVEAEILASNRRMTAGIRGSGGPGRPRALGAGGAANEVKGITRVRISEEEKVVRAKERLHAKFVAFEGREIERITRQRLAGFEKERIARTKLAESMSKGIGTSVKSTARTAAFGATAVGGALIASALYDQVQVQKGASRVANQGMHPELKGQIARESQNIRGFTGEESIDALDQFVQKTGELQAGMGAWKMLGELAVATSTDFKDMGNAAGTAYNFIADSVKDPTERMKQLKDVMTTLAVQGNMSTVEMRDLAPVLGKISAAARRFGGDPVLMLKKLSAMGQLAVKRGGATDAAEETTSLSRFVDDLIADSGSKKKRGKTSVFTDKSMTKLKDPIDIVTGIMEETQGNLVKIGAKFGVRGQRALSGLGNVWQKAHDEAEAQKKGTGNAAGAAAIAGGVGELVGANKDIKESANLRYKDADIQFEEATKSFNRAIGEQLLPAVTKLIPEFVQLVPAATYLTAQLVKFVDWLSQNPYEGLGALILGKVAADIAMAGIGKGLAFLLSGIIRSAVPGATGGLVGPALNAAGAGVGLLAGGITKGATALTGALGIGGAAGGAAVAGAGALAAGGVALAGWQGKKLYDETQGFTDFSSDGGKANTPDEYDQMIKKAGLNPAGSGSGGAATAAAAEAQQKSAADLAAAAVKLSGAADKLAMQDPARSKPIVAR